MFRFIKEHSGSLIFSILLHGVIVAALVTGIFKFRESSKPTPMPQLAIQATVVDEKQVQAEMRRQEDDRQREQRQAQESAERLRQEQEAERQRLEDLRSQRQNEEEIARRRIEQQRIEDQERRRQAELETKRKAEADARAEAQRKLKAEAERRQRQEEDRRKALEARARAEKEAALKARLAEEARRQGAIESGLLAQYVAQIRSRIQRAWIRPPNTKPGLKCVVNVTQGPGGEVISAKVGECNGDDIVRRSIEAAVMRASPLPTPPDPSLFERNLRLEFKPDDE
jgi:colicin import membrane protein